MKDNITIKHIPNGLNDPYQHYEYERYPRNPIESDFVIIKAVMEPYSPEQNVLLQWSLNGNKQKPHIGRRIIDHVKGKEYFEFEIGRFIKKDLIQYYIEVEDKGEIYRSRTFDFSVGENFYLGKVERVSASNNIIAVEFEKTNSLKPKLNFYFEKGYLKILISLEDLDKKREDDNSFSIINDNHYFYKDSITGSQLEIIKNPFKFVIKDNKGNMLLGSYQDILNYLEWQDYFDGRIDISLRFQTESQNFYGFGEKYDRLNQKGLQPDICVYDQYQNQQSKTYMPIPFFFAENGYGMYIKSSQYLKYDLYNKLDNLIEIKGRLNKRNPALELYILFGEPDKIFNDFLSLTGFPVLPPKWAFGPWMSANSWNAQQKVLEQVKTMNQLKIPATVLVVEAWSDEATFYIFNDAIYKSKSGAKVFSYKDFEFSEGGKWPDPKNMIDFIHKNNLKFILWQIPTIKHLREGEENKQHAQDELYAMEKGFCVMNEDGTPYRITGGGWFADSLLIDFSNPEAKEWWFSKRRYLIEDLSVDGFKTDGGEFIFDDNLIFYNGLKGDEMRNLYPLKYIAAYNEFMGKDGVTFSRAGFTGAQKYSLYWGGDQLSSFKTLKSLIIAGLSINISGNPFWGWDIAGFAGEIPTVELYVRSTQIATFCPIMQFHSDTQNENWDRTPWNIAERNEDKRALEIYRDYANLRMNILPYIYNEAIHVTENGEPMMRPLVFDYTDDKRVYDIEDEYLFGRFLLIAPVTEEGQRQREIYLPEGEWIDFWDGAKYNGQQYIRYLCDLDKIPVFIKNNSVVPFNLNNNFEIGGYIGNKVDLYHNLCFMIVGEIKEKYIFKDDLGNKILFTQENGKIKVDISGKIDGIYIISSKPLSLEGHVAKCVVKQNLNVYKIINLI